MEQNVVNALKPIGIHAGMSMEDLEWFVAEPSTLFLLVTVDGRDLLVVKEEQSWGVPSGRPKPTQRGFFMDMVPEILPRQIITPWQDGMKKVEVLGSAGDVNGYGATLVLCVQVDSSCVVRNSRQDHTWVRSMKGFKRLLTATGQSREQRNIVVRHGVQEAIKRGLLNWGQGATAH